MSATTFQTINPANGSVLKTYSYATTSEIESALTQAERGQREWQSTALSKRADVLHAAAKTLRARVREYAELMTKEMGKPLAQSESEIEKCALTCDYYAENAGELLAPKTVESERARGRVFYEPLGTVLAIMPWNFPFWQVFRFAAPNLMAGNTGLLKHSHNVAGCAAAISEVFREAGAPEGVFSHLDIPSEEVARLLGDDRIAAVTLTGSTRAGKSVAETAGRYMKKGVYELGGSDPYVVLADADVEKAAKICAEARLINSGQSCIAAKRFIVLQEVAKPFGEAFRAELASHVVGDPMDRGHNVGPLAREDLRDELARQVEASLAKGASIQLGGKLEKSEGFFYPVTLLIDVGPGMPAFDDELFGPVAAVTVCRTEDEAFSLAGQSIYGLGAALFTRDVERGIELAAKRLPAGACAVNTNVRSDPDFPFGGIKQSGYGRELGEPALREFVNIKSILVGN